MTDQEKLDFIKQAIQKISKKEVPEITPDMVLDDDLGLDSLDIVEIQLHYEETFNVETEDSNVSTVRDLMNIMA